MKNLEKCQCGACVAPGSWKKISDSVNECGYCREWQVVDKEFPEKTEKITRHYSDGTTKTEETTINAIARSATLEECVEASMVKNRAKRNDLDYNKLICEDIFYHSKEGSKLINEIYLTKHELEKANSKTKSEPIK